MAERPNIVLFNCDDLGYGDLSCYGHPRNRTPFLDRLAGMGIRFTDFYMASPVCSPSRAAMLTGCYPPRIGMDEFNGFAVQRPGDGCGLNPNEITFARMLKDAGYATGMCGKWHCGDNWEFMPCAHGFDEYYGIPYSNDMGHQAREDKTIEDNYPPLPLVHNTEVVQEQPDQSGLTERFVEHAVSFLRRHKDEPFLYYFAETYVHLPLYPPAAFRGTSANGAYGDCVAAVDWSVHAVYRELEKLGLLENTLLIFTSDNGSRDDFGGSNGPLRGTKRTTWDGGQRVPFIAYWKGHTPEGKVCAELTNSLDLYATFAHLCGGRLPDDRKLDTLDMTDLLLGRTEKSPRDTFFYYFKHQLEAVRHGKWKLHVYKENVPMLALYDLENDTGETTDVSAEHPETVAELQKLLAEARRDMGDSLTGETGENVRPAGKAEHPDTLTHLNMEDPYIIALYDLTESG